MPATEVAPPTGYLHPAYAGSLAEFGTPRRLPRSGAWILERAIPGSVFRDAMACYPLLMCHDWAGLGADLDDLAGRFVSISAVTDPFGSYRPDDLARCFSDLMVPFKNHFIIDLGQCPLDRVSDHHRRNARKALRQLVIERCACPEREEAPWQSLYATLVRRHEIIGIRAFSPAALNAQLRVPGAVLFQAKTESETVGMTLWYVSGDTGYYHLGACSEDGYELRALFGLFWYTIEYFAASGLRLLGLGGGAGLTGSAEDGLSRFKRGWSTGTCPSLLVWPRPRPFRLSRTGGPDGDPANRLFPRVPAGGVRLACPRQWTRGRTSRIVRFTEDFLDRHGDSYLGVGWTKRQEDADTRYEVMLGVLSGERGQPVTLLDFGCGASHLYEYLQAHKRTDIAYSGLDISPRFLALSRGKYPHVTYYDVDVLEGDGGLPAFDYIVMNGLFTAKCDLTFDGHAGLLPATGPPRLRQSSEGHGVQRHVQASRLGAGGPVSSPVRRADLLPGARGQPTLRHSTRLWSLRIHDLCLPRSTLRRLVGRRLGNEITR